MKSISALLLIAVLLPGIGAVSARAEKEKSAEGIDYLVLVNKRSALPEGWEDALQTVTVMNSVGDEVEVEAKAYDAYLALKEDLEENDGIYLELDSARRSFAAQQDIKDRFTEKYGADYAARTAATPGCSEHHTGLALDLYFRRQGDDGKYTDVIRELTGKEYPEGDFVYKDGTVLGRHKGIICYTRGQRKGLGLASEEPLYVLKVDPIENKVYLGRNNDLFSTSLLIDDFNWTCGIVPTEPLRCKAKVRYKHKEQPCTATVMEDGKVRVVFDEPQRAITPGQACVLYDEDEVIGGGTIQLENEV